MVAVGCLAERYGRSSRSRCLRRPRCSASMLIPTSPAGSHDVIARPTRRLAQPASTGARCCPSPRYIDPAAAAEIGCPGTPGCHAPRRRLDDGPVAYAEAGLRVRPALRVLRDPVLPRLVRVPTRRRRARRGAVARRARASASSCWSARTRRPTARTSATCGRSRRCCPSWPPIDGIERVRVSYLQPAELRPTLVEAIATTPGVAPYFDLSFQHASRPVLRRMRRFGGPRTFLDLLGRIRALAPRRGCAQQRDRRLPRRDRGRRRRARAVPDRGPARRRRRVRLLRRGRHRGRRLRRASSTSDDRRAGRADHDAGRRARSPSGPRTGSARQFDVLVEPWRRRRAGRPRGAPGPGRRRQPRRGASTRRRGVRRGDTRRSRGSSPSDGADLVGDAPVAEDAS